MIKHSREWPPACPYDRSWSSPSFEPWRHRELTRGRCRRGGWVSARARRRLAATLPSLCESSRPILATIRRPPSWSKSSNATGPGTTMARASNCCNFSTPGGWSIRRRSPKGASFPRRFFLEGGGNSRPGPVLLRHPRATFGADDGSRTRMAEGRGILSPLRLPVSPRPHTVDNYKIIGVLAHSDLDRFYLI